MVLKQYSITVTAKIGMGPYKYAHTQIPFGAAVYACIACAAYGKNLPVINTGGNIDINGDFFGNTALTVAF